MPTVKHLNRFVENNPRVIRDDEVQRYYQDGWFIIEKDTPPVQSPAECLSVKPEVSISFEEKHVQNDQPIIPDNKTINTTLKQDFQRGRGRPPKWK
jgi:hypothetical protein